MKAARPLSFQERQELSTKLSRMQAAVERNRTTRRLRAVKAEHPGCEEITRNDLPRVDGRYSLVAS